MKRKYAILIPFSTEDGKPQYEIYTRFPTLAAARRYQVRRRWGKPIIVKLITVYDRSGNAV